MKSSGSVSQIIKFLTALVTLAFTFGCAASPTGEEVSRVKPPPRAPGSALKACPNNRLCIEVVVDSAGCPVYTRYQGELDKVPTFPTAIAKRIRWLMVNEQGAEQPVDFAVYFDPFRGQDIGGTGQADSKQLDPTTPTGVNFKYTLVTPECQYLDPQIRVN
jgi:hypothetical protein